MNYGNSSNPSNFTVNLETTNEFFVGNLNKQKTRDEIFQDLTNINIECLNENLYISKFNMPKFNARKDAHGHLLLNLGYAFVTAKKPEMAAEMIKRKRVKLGDGSDIEIKPVCRTKRMAANANCKTKNAVKFNQTVGDGRSVKSRNFSSCSQNDNFWYNPREQNNYNQVDRNDQYFSSSSRSNSRFYPEDFSNNQTRYNPPQKKPFENLFCAPASLNVSQNNSSGQLWSSFADCDVNQTTDNTHQSIFDIVALASSSDDGSSDHLVCEKMLRSSSSFDKINGFEMTRERRWSNKSRS